MLGIFLNAPLWARMVVAVAVLAGGIAMTVYGVRGRPKFRETTTLDGRRIVEALPSPAYADMALYCGFATTALGGVLVAVAGRSDSEKHGYTSI